MSQSEPRRSVVLAALLVSGCMIFPQHGTEVTTMGAPVRVTGTGGVGAALTYQYARFKLGPSGYTIVGWTPLTSCTASGLVYTDVNNKSWQGCDLYARIPVSDSTYGGIGAWHGNFATPADGQRYALLRGFADGFPMTTFPVTTPLSVLQATLNQSGGVGVITQYGTTTMTSELHVTAPRVSTTDMAGTVDATDVIVRTHYAYVTRAADGSGNGALAIFDIAAPGAPVLLSTFPVVGGVNRIALEGPFAYLVTTDTAHALTVVDVTDPAAPVERTHTNVIGTAEAIAVNAIGDVVYVGTRAQPANYPELTAWQLDFAPGGGLDFLSASPHLGADVRDIDVSDVRLADGTHGRVHVATSDPAHAFRVLDPAGLTMATLGDYPAPAGAQRVEYHEGRLYGLLEGTASPNFVVLGVAPAGTLTQQGTLTLPTTNTDLRLYGGRALVTTTDPAHGLTIVDVRNPTSPVKEADRPTTGAGRALDVRSGVAYVAGGDDAAELQLVSSALPLDPQLVDVNGDNQVTVTCFGDSNTAGVDSWCPRIQSAFADSTWRTVNRGAGFSIGVSLGNWHCPGDPDNNWPDSFEQVPLAFDPVTGDKPEAIVLAYGEWDGMAAVCNDSGSPSYPYYQNLEATVDAYRAHQQTASDHGAVTFVVEPSLVAPTFSISTCHGSCTAAEMNATLTRLGNRIRHEFPRERVIDFLAASISPLDILGDHAVHLNAIGEQLRADEALAHVQHP